MNHRLRVKLPVQVVDIDPASGSRSTATRSFITWKIFRGGDRHYSQIYTEVVDTGAKATSVQVAAEKACPVSKPRLPRPALRGGLRHAPTRTPAPRETHLAEPHT